MIHDLAMIFLGSLLTYFGFVGGAIVERIRRGPAPRAPRLEKRSAPVRSERAAEWSDAVELEVPAVTRRKRAASPIAAMPVVPMLNDVRDALVGLGYSKPIAQAAAADARRKIGDGAPLEVWIREALQCCPKPSAVTS